MKRRNWTFEQKLQLLQDAKSIGVLKACRKLGIYTGTYYDWKEKFEQGGEAALKDKTFKIDPALKKALKENERLKRLLADKELEIMVKNELLEKKSPLRP